MNKKLLLQTVLMSFVTFLLLLMSLGQPALPPPSSSARAAGPAVAGRLDRSLSHASGNGSDVPAPTGCSDVVFEDFYTGDSDHNPRASFYPGESVYFVFEVNNNGSTSESVRTDLETRDPNDQIVNQLTGFCEYEIGPGRYSLGCWGDIPSDAMPGQYSVQGTLQCGSISSRKSTTFVVVGPTPTSAPTATATATKTSTPWPDINVSKSVLTSPPIQVGDAVQFEIVVENIGDTELSTLELRDHYDPTYLTYVNADPASDNNDDDGRIEWSNLDPMQAHEDMTLIVNFVAHASTQGRPGRETVNEAQISATDENGSQVEDSARAFLKIVWPTTSPTTTPTPTVTPNRRTTATATPTRPPVITSTPTATSTPFSHQARVLLPAVARNYVGFVPPTCDAGFEAGHFTPCWDHGGELAQRVVDRLDTGEPPFAGHYSALLGQPELGSGTTGNIPAGSAWIQQRIRVSNTSYPRLAFQYRVISYDASVGSTDRLWDTFDVFIGEALVFRDDHGEARPPGSQGGRHDTGWQHAEVDLSRWRGQEVSLRFAVWNREYDGNGMDYYNTWAYLDQVRIEP